jgi:hypothetical protein
VVDGILRVIPVEADLLPAPAAAGVVVAFFILCGARILRRAVSDVDPNEALR